MNKRLLIPLVLAVSGLFPAAFGVTTWKGSVSGYWDIATNWAGDFPASNSTVRLNHERQPNTYTVMIRTPAVADKLWMDTYGDVPVHVRVTSSGSLQLNSMRMGFKEEDRESSFTIDGGSVWGLDPADPGVTNTAFLIGNNPGCNATLSVLNQGRLSVMGSNGLIVASSKESTGRLVVTNANMQINDSLTLGKGPDALGELLISGTSSVSITGALHIAKLELGTLFPTARVQVSGGTLECGTLNIGAHGIGSFILSDGLVRTFDGGITLGQTASTAQLNIHGGTMETVGSSMNIGHLDSDAVLVMTNGNLKIDGSITLGSASRSTGRLDLSGGTITSKELIIGAATSSTGTVHLRDGELVILGSDHDSIQIANSELRIEKALIKWNNANITDWITNTIANGSIVWSNGWAHGTYSTNGFDGSFSRDGKTLYWDNLDNGSSFTQSAIWVEESPYNTWAGGYLLSGSNAFWSADPDHDGFDNLWEYGLGGDPTNGFNPGIMPVLQFQTGSAMADYSYRQRSDPVAYGLTYTVELSTNLLTQTWTTNGYPLQGGIPGTDGFSWITNSIPTGNKTLFIRLKIQHQ